VSDLFKTVTLPDANTGLMSEQELQALPNIGPAVAGMLMRLGVQRPVDLHGQTADELYGRLCEADGRRHDPCLLDTLVAAVDYVNGAPARPWWYYSRIRKAQV
jgi:hypothetical protein